MGKNRTSLKCMLRNTLNGLSAFGESKHQAKQIAKDQYIKENGNLKGYNPAKTDKIYSINTMQSYKQSCDEFAQWVKDTKGITRLQDNSILKSYAIQYLQARQADGKSAWTISKDMAALNKAAGLNLNKKDCNLNNRSLKNITRSRGGQGRLKDMEQIKMTQGCGMRYQSMQRITASDFNYVNGIAVSVNLHEKGGKSRTAPIIKAHQQEITNIINKNDKGTGEPLFSNYDIHANNHYYRAEYAKELLIEKEKEKLQCGQLLDSKCYGHDKECCQIVSNALGHNRLSVLANYIK